MNDVKCKNCGGDKGIHHYQTNQCPVGGREAPVGKKDEYMASTFESNELEELSETVRQLLIRVEELEEKVDRLQNESDLAETVRIWI